MKEIEPYLNVGIINMAAATHVGSSLHAEWEILLRATGGPAGVTNRIFSQKDDLILMTKKDFQKFLRRPRASNPLMAELEEFNL